MKDIIPKIWLEGVSNLLSGTLTFGSGFVAGASGVKIPGKINFRNMIINNLFSILFGVYPMKILMSLIFERIKK